MSLWINLTYQPAESDDVYTYLQTDVQGNILQKGQAQLNQMPATSEVVAIIPAGKVSWQKIQLPPTTNRKNPHKILPIIHGLLEEQLLDDISELHFVLQPKQYYEQDNELIQWVGICDKNWLRQHIDQIQTAGLALQRIIPEMAPSNSAEENSFWIKDQHDKSFLFSCCEQGVFMQPINAKESLQPLITIPEGANVFIQPSLANEVTLSHSLKPQLITDAAQITAFTKNEWNFAQFEFQLSRHDHYLKQLSKATNILLYQRQWRYARIGLLTLVITAILGLNIWAMQERKQILQLQQQIKQNFSTAFPNVPLIASADKMMQREVRLLRQRYGSADSSSFNQMLNLAAVVLPNSIELNAIKYEGEVLTLTSKNLPAEQQQQIQQDFSQYGYLANYTDDRLSISRQTP